METIDLYNFKIPYTFIASFLWTFGAHVSLGTLLVFRMDMSWNICASQLQDIHPAESRKSSPC